MDPKNKFASETVRQLQQSLDEIAPYQATELSKQEAIRQLAPQIFTLRSKGYSWAAVAAMLSERGVPVSVAALRTYLRRVREEAANDASRTPTKRLRDGRTDTLQPERSPSRAPSPSTSGETPPARKPPQSSAPPALAISAPHASRPGPRA